MADKTRRDEDGELLTRTKTHQPKRYKVLLFNDDYTTQVFVVEILQTIFKHNPASATRLMLAIHKTGVGIAGVYTKEIAETRVEQALGAARERGHPLQCSMEPE